jgi:transcriptional regulator with XRE-family HTH domain
VHKVSFQNTLGNALRVVRQSRRLTQHQVARIAGVSVPTIRLLERGRGNLRTWSAVLERLGLELVGRNLPTGAHLGYQLAALRKRRGLGQRAVAALVRVSQPTLVAFEREGQGRVQTLDRLLTVLGGGAYLAPQGSTRPFYTHAGNSSGPQAWRTPQLLLSRLYRVFGRFDLDPCSPVADRRRAPVQARVRYTRDDDGLVLPWFGTVFVNPPYGRELPYWVAKAAREVGQGRARVVVLLMPARTDTSYWHRYVAGQAHIFFLLGRLRFDEEGTPAPFPSAFAVWGGTDDVIAHVREALAEAWYVGKG